jgi:hypothetical protein
MYTIMCNGGRSGSETEPDPRTGYSLVHGPEEQQLEEAGTTFGLAPGGSLQLPGLSSPAPSPATWSLNTAAHHGRRMVASRSTSLHLAATSAVASSSATSGSQVSVLILVLVLVMVLVLVLVLVSVLDLANGKIT